jgi:hypothetical protein
MFLFGKSAQRHGRCCIHGVCSQVHLGTDAAAGMIAALRHIGTRETVTPASLVQQAAWPVIFVLRHNKSRFAGFCSLEDARNA